MPGAYDYDTIAELYGAIRTLLSQLVETSGEDNIFCSDAAMQIGADLVSLPGLTVITNLASALTAIDTIVFQGEGSPADHDASHFARFAQIKREYQSLLVQRSTFNPSRPAAVNPVMRPPADREGRVYVDSPHAARVLDLANAIYNHMIRLLASSNVRTRQTKSLC